MKEKIQIALVDDERLFLEGLSLLLSNNDKLEVVISSDDGNEFLDRLTKISPDNFPEVALIDICMKPMDGFELVQNLKKKPPQSEYYYSFFSL